MPFLQRTFHTHAPAAALLIRLMVGCVFLSEGLQKFFLPMTRGIGRFEQIGIPIPGLTSPLVGAVEVIFGLLILFGILTRLATIPLLIDMAVAIVTTKLPLLHQRGFWDMLHESRTDFCVVMGLLFLLWVGAGPVSLDRLLPEREIAYQKEQL